jgi:muconolactone delta-isomerase
MLFFVEMDHVRSSAPQTPEAGRAFIEQIILPTIARSEQLIAEKRILVGGPVAGRVALRLMIEAESHEQLDRILTGLPLWRAAETHVTPLISFSDRRAHVQALLESSGAAR